MNDRSAAGGTSGREEPGLSPLWQFVKLSEYTLPAAVLDVSSVRRGVRGLIRSLFETASEPDSPLDAEHDLLTLGEAELEALVPPPQWSAAAAVMHEQLRDWIEPKHLATPILFLVGAPYSGHVEILHALAERKPFAAVAPPGMRSVLRCDDRWFRSWPRKEPWIVPQLEKCYLRRPDGFDLVRELLARALSGELGRGIIGCDSWAWVFLRHVYRGRRSFSQTVQAFDHRRLARLFAPAEESNRRRHFRHSDSGVFVLPPSADASSSGSEPPSERSAAAEHGKDAPRASTAFLERLAAYSRGNPGVAGAIWRSALQSLPEPTTEAEMNSADRRRRDTIWVKPWHKLAHPELPADSGMNEALTLHALLLHDGLASPQLAELLPGSRADVLERLLYLAEAGLVAEGEDRYWRVTATGYPAVRSFLEVNDCLVDQF